MLYRGLTVFVTVLLLSSESRSEMTRDQLGEFIHQYRGLTCDQIGAEAQTLASRIRAALPAKANRPIKKTEAAVILWPDFSKLDNESASKLKDQILAIEEAIIEQQCGIQFEAQPPLGSQLQGGRR
jgi:hypothetical protein